MRGIQWNGPLVVVLSLAGLGFQVKLRRNLSSRFRTLRRLSGPRNNSAPAGHQRSPAARQRQPPTQAYANTAPHPEPDAVKPSSDAPNRPKVSPDDNPFPEPGTSGNPSTAGCRSSVGV